MTENKNLTVNDKTCTSNFDCTSDETGGIITPVESTGCISDSASATASGLTRYNSKTLPAQMSTIDTQIQNELARRRLTPKYSSLSYAQYTALNHSAALNRIKLNLERLGVTASGDFNKYSVAAQAQIDNVYTALNQSRTNCTCDTRCTCNARGNTAWLQEDCKTRCNCYARCTCNANLSYSYDPTWGACTCNARCNCNSDTSTYLYDCACDIRTSVQCSCNIRCTCNARTSN